MNKIIKAAVHRLYATSWWDAMSDEHKKAYVEEHPHSKYADDYKKTKAPKEHKNGTPTAKSLSDSVKALPKAEQEFYAAGEHKPGSKARAKAAHLVKSKSKGLLAHIKGQAHEWKTGVSAIKKLAHKQPLDHHDKEALKAVAQDIIITVAGVAIAGGLAHGVVAAFAHLGKHLFQDAVLKAVGHAAVHAKASDGTDDELMLKVINNLADSLADYDIPEDVLAKAVAPKE